MQSNVVFWVSFAVISSVIEVMLRRKGNAIEYYTKREGRGGGERADRKKLSLGGEHLDYDY